MTKKEAKDIATALVAISGMNYDLFAFEECDLSDKDICKVLKEIDSLCEKMKKKIEDKYDVTFRGLTSEVVDLILYEQ